MFRRLSHPRFQPWRGLLQATIHAPSAHQYLTSAARSSKAKFPACGGFVVWMGHDAFPCGSNTSLLDFDGVPKPAAHALTTVFISTSTVSSR